MLAISQLQQHIDKPARTTDSTLGISIIKYKETFLQISDFHVQCQSKKIISEYQPWLTNEIKQLTCHRDYFKRKRLNLIPLHIMKHTNNAKTNMLHSFGTQKPITSKRN